MLSSAHIRLLVYTALVIQISCMQKKQDGHVDTAKRQYIEQQNPVEVIILKRGTFQNELVSNGKLKALLKNELKFQVNAKIEAINVKNGDFVEKGQVIASLRQFEYLRSIEKVNLQLKNAGLELQNILIGQGYNLQDSLNIPVNIWDMAIVRSGYSAALNELKTATFNLQATELKAPFAGKIANIKQKVHEQLNSGEAFCTLIDDSEFEVEFYIIENEISQISLNDEVKIIPFSIQKIFKGQISEINPIVNENGLIMIKARLKNTGRLMEGMNVRVLIEKEIPGQLVVPKQAVVLRDNQEVLFTYKNGIAFWTYIQSLHENSSSYSVIAHPDKGANLEPGDTIIVSGNLNLAHESKVVIK